MGAKAGFWEAGIGIRLETDLLQERLGRGGGEEGVETRTRSEKFGDNGERGWASFCVTGFGVEGVCGVAPGAPPRLANGSSSSRNDCGGDDWVVWAESSSTGGMK